jgi:hypothetical protein
MKKSLLVTVLMMGFLVSACQGAESITVDDPTEAGSMEVADILPTEPGETAVEDPDGVEPVVDEPIATTIETLTGPTSECTLVSSLPEPSAEYADIFAVREDDWAFGPEDAAVTIIEYGDFQ